MATVRTFVDAELIGFTDDEIEHVLGYYLSDFPEEILQSVDLMKGKYDTEDFQLMEEHFPGILKKFKSALKQAELVNFTTP